MYPDLSCIPCMLHFVYCQQKYSVESPGLNEEVTRRRHLGLTFHRYLTQLKSMQVGRSRMALNTT